MCVYWFSLFWLNIYCFLSNTSTRWPSCRFLHQIQLAASPRLDLTEPGLLTSSCPPWSGSDASGGTAKALTAAVVELEWGGNRWSLWCSPNCCRLPTPVLPPWRRSCDADDTKWGFSQSLFSSFPLLIKDCCIKMMLCDLWSPCSAGLLN